jgi:hypothetical protein
MKVRENIGTLRQLKLTCMRTFLISFFLLITAVCCAPKDPNKQIDVGKVSENVYTNDEIGWQITLPDDWDVMEKDKLEAQQKKGMEMVEQTLDTTVDYSTVNHLISFQKDQFNIFLSTSDRYDEEIDGSWAESRRIVRDVIYNTFADQGIKADTSSTSEVINELEFDVFKTTIYSPKGDVILNQDIYSRLIRGHLFSVVINYNNEADKQTMMDAWRNSRFRK